MNYATSPEEVALALRKAKEPCCNDSYLGRPVCRQCEFYDFDEMSDEAYCAAKDYEEIRIYRKHRPDWCPRLNK